MNKKEVTIWSVFEKLPNVQQDEIQSRKFMVWTTRDSDIVYTAHFDPGLGWTPVTQARGFFGELSRITHWAEIITVDNQPAK